MRKYIISIAAMLLSVSALAGVVTKTQAENVAKNVLGASSVQYVWNGLGDLKYGDVNPAFYVFNSSDGWAVIAADDCAVPVLMHGEGTFELDKVPANMLSLLGDVENNIFTARNQKLAQAPEIKQAWSEYSVVTKSDPTPTPPLQVLLETASWNQGSPYNNLCPMDGGNRSITGCVATAMSILMRYYEWPEKGKGQIPGYSTASKAIAVGAIDIDGFEYDWDNMPLVYSGSSSEAEKNAVARLMAHAGAMVQMDYSASSSGASSSDIVPAMVKYMSYSSSACELYRSEYTNGEWFRMIKAEIDSSHPVIYGGENVYTNSGHQFICDGYNANNEVHINWGWGGYQNAWFAVCYLGEVEGEGPAVYSRSDSAIFGLVPDNGSGSDPLVPTLVVCNAYSGGITLTSGTIAKGNNFTINLSSIWNIGGEEYSGLVKPALMDKAGNIKEFISSSAYNLTIPVKSLYRGLSYNCTITEDIDFGDYISILCSYGDDKWVPVRAYWADTAEPVTQLHVIDVTVMDIPSTFAVGQLCYPDLIFGQKKAASVNWYVDGNLLSADHVKMTSGTHTFKAVIKYTDDSTETIVKQVTAE